MHLAMMVCCRVGVGFECQVSCPALAWRSYVPTQPADFLRLFLLRYFPPPAAKHARQGVFSRGTANEEMLECDRVRACEEVCILTVAQYGFIHPSYGGRHTSQWDHGAEGEDAHHQDESLHWNREEDTMSVECRPAWYVTWVRGCDIEFVRTLDQGCDGSGIERSAVIQLPPHTLARLHAHLPLQRSPRRHVCLSVQQVGPLVSVGKEAVQNTLYGLPQGNRVVNSRGLFRVKFATIVSAQDEELVGSGEAEVVTVVVTVIIISFVVQPCGQRIR